MSNVRFLGEYLKKKKHVNLCRKTTIIISGLLLENRCMSSSEITRWFVSVIFFKSKEVFKKFTIHCFRIKAKAKKCRLIGELNSINTHSA